MLGNVFWWVQFPLLRWHLWKQHITLNEPDTLTQGCVAWQTAGGVMQHLPMPLQLLTSIDQCIDTPVVGGKSIYMTFQYISGMACVCTILSILFEANSPRKAAAITAAWLPLYIFDTPPEQRNRSLLASGNWTSYTTDKIVNGSSSCDPKIKLWSNLGISREWFCCVIMPWVNWDCS